MEFGVQFFPCVGPDRKSGEQYFRESLDIAELCDRLGFGHIRTVEHYFLPYGGYSPNPLIFLAAAAQRTRTARLITGAVLPVFNHPLKLAGEIGMLDAISGGRLEVGFARAFLPHEFRRFDVSVDESKARFAEGMEQVRQLLENDVASSSGRFHSFSATTSLPRPTQKPRPPFWIAATATPESFVAAGRAGHNLMTIPMAGATMRELLSAYREAWRAAGHPGNGRVMLAFHAFCWPNQSEAHDIARPRVERYLQSIVGAASDWDHLQSADYRGYDKMLETLRKESFDGLLEKNAIFVGTPKQVREQVMACQEATGGFESASCQLNFDDLPFEMAAASTKLMGLEVLPHFRNVSLSIAS